MSLLFSKVKVTADEDWRATSFLVGGKPSKINDLEGWTEFENFLEALEDNECELKFKIQSFLYGDGESVTASPEEIAYLMTKGAGLFNSVLLKQFGNSQFSFNYDPYRENFYGMEQG